jgi:hypothetical protein
MEELAGTKTETFDELVTKHTRRELEELALKYGIENLGGTKSQLADFILDAMKKQKELPKSQPQTSSKEAPLIEKTKTPAKMESFGKKGVLAKANAINNKSADLKRAGKEIRDEGIREMNQSVKEFQAAGSILSRNMHSEARKMIEDGQKRFNQGQLQLKQSIDAQMKENHEAVSRMHIGTHEIMVAQGKMAREFQKAGKNIRDEGCRNLQNGLAKCQSNLNAQIKENREAVSKLYTGAREMQGRAMSFQNEIHRYQEQDLKNYVKDFYYG